ncbi:MAG: 4Fe-4S binding protein [Planctomycetales bacterium]|nr:4Fe-4S binding protein [Planctomycetales bacterium]
MIRWLVPIARRCVQLLSLGVLVLLPIMALYTHFKEAHAIHDLGENNWRNVAVRGIARVVNKDDRHQQLLERTQGTIWSARLFGVSLSDPLAGAEAIISSRSFYKPMLWSLLIPVAVTVLLGRVFCGWICPMNTLLEFVDKCRRLLRIAEIRERDVKFSLKNKYFVLTVVLGLVGVTGVPFVALFYPPAVMSREMHLFVFGSTVGIGAYVLLAICAIELFVSKRWWCRYICPGGALYSLLGRFRVVRIERDENKCVHCGECVRVCQFDLRPMLVQITGMECTNCGNCVRACDDDALRFRWMLPVIRMTNDERPNDEGGPNAEARTVPAQILRHSIFVIFSSFVIGHSSLAHAHHILGLPHYSYKENYPQAPTLEYPATTGPYDLLMTSFPGHPVPGERTTIAFYIKDRNTGLPYELPVSLRAVRTATFGENTLIFEPTVHEPTGNQHKYFVTFPDDGEYIAELTMDVEGKPEVIPFLMIAGEPTATKSVVIAIGAGLGVFLLVVRAIKVKRNRRRAANQRGTEVPHQPTELLTSDL